MLTKTEILTTLNSFAKNDYARFLHLNNTDMHIIQTRLNVFRDNSGRWAIVAELLQYDVEMDEITLTIMGFGNCLRSSLDDIDRNYYDIHPVDEDSYENSMLDGVLLCNGVNYWIVRGTKLPIPCDDNEYHLAGIDVEENIYPQDVARLLVSRYPVLFRATMDELLRLVPADIEKILVLDEWYHQDLHRHIVIRADEGLFASQIGILDGYCFNTMDTINSLMDLLYEEEEIPDIRVIIEEVDDHLPSECETWQLLADVIITGDPAVYTPTQAPNTYWKYWEHSGHSYYIDSIPYFKEYNEEFNKAS